MSVLQAPVIQKAEDAAHSSGDRGIVLLGVRKDTAAALAGTDGDYTPIITDTSGRLHANVGSVLGVTATGQATMADSLPVVLASDQEVTLSVSPAQIAVHVTGASLAASPAASYAIGDSVGSVHTIGVAAVVKAVRLESLIFQAFGPGTGTWDMTVLIFKNNPIDSTFTDDAAATIHANDYANVEAVIEIVDADWVTLGGRKYCNIPRERLGQMISTSSDVFGAIIAGATFDGPANDLEVTYGFAQG